MAPSEHLWPQLATGCSAWGRFCFACGRLGLTVWAFLLLSELKVPVRQGPARSRGVGERSSSAGGVCVKIRVTRLRAGARFVSGLAEGG